MTGIAESILVEASMSALEYHEAAWDAHDQEAHPPDPAGMSDEALDAVLHYDARDLPTEARRVIEQEWQRRRPAGSRTDEVVMFAVLAMLGASGASIGWVLFVP
jgi:hypothetical protein